MVLQTRKRWESPMGVPNIQRSREGDIMDYDEFYWTTEAMIRKSGGFVRRLGDLVRAGDPDNQKRLVDAFPEYWNTYKIIGNDNKEEWAAED